ncbi:prepronociceptin b [Trichomycterus rosablanca]|uniref:prepronociceptin b n=1 Tax=Trichomycterus rosablanca TaxID=2290929 RepID=UPI002F35C98E
MKTPFWALLFLSLCVPGRSDCQEDCLTCGLLLPSLQSFDTLVCLMECEALASPGHSLDLCNRALSVNVAALPSQELSKRTDDEEKPVALLNIKNNGVEYSEALERFRHAAQALSSHRSSEEGLRSDRLEDTSDQGVDLSMEDEQGQNAVDTEEEQNQESNASLSLSKRFGGFIKGRHGFRKLVSSGRPLQKRYGGFIGIRKSARKWNNQKRVSQLLRQYLSLTARTGRSGRFANLSAAVRQKNEV